MDPREEPQSVAANIADFQGCPDIIGLSEIGDTDGRDSSGETSANKTLQEIARETSKAFGGVPDTFTHLGPIDWGDGGQPGQNIQVAFLNRQDKVELVRGAPKGGPDYAVSYDTRTSGLSVNPGRIEPSVHNNSRKPLAGEFRFVTAVVVDHWGKPKFEEGKLF